MRQIYIRFLRHHAGETRNVNVLEGNLSLDLLKCLFEKTKESRVNFDMPKFSMRWMVDLKPVLAQLNVTAWTDRGRMGQSKDGKSMEISSATHDVYI